tara:strand:- start:5376 stop:6647 length:1272 start_codon:yes stop_codon:yes gene_type:complete
MSVEYFISKKIYSTKEKNNSYTKPILRIAIFAIALSVAIMLISIMVIGGFKKNITSKVVGFGSHIIISKQSYNSFFEKEPIKINLEYLNTLKSDPLIKHVNVFAEKPAVIKTQEEIHPIILKGVSTDYSWSFFKQNLIKGKVPTLKDNGFSNDILISKYISNILNIDVNDTLNLYFAQQPPRVKKLKVVGIYKTEMIDFDEIFVLGSIKHIQKLNNWNNINLSSENYENNLVGGYEITLKDINDLDIVAEKIYEIESPVHPKFGAIDISTIKQTKNQIFQWLDLQDINVKIILFLMLTVATINMITTLLIIILDRINLIGTLKAIGYNNWSIRKIFLFISTKLITRGLLYGNIIAFSIAIFQKYFSLIKLDPKTYYMSTVPIDFNFINIIYLNIGTLIICYLILILPSYIITKIEPIKSIKFE